jgi:hypothetical protein
VATVAAAAAAVTTSPSRRHLLIPSPQMNDADFAKAFLNTLKQERLPVTVCQEQSGAEDSQRPLILVAAEHGHWHLVHSLLQLGCSPTACHVGTGETLATSLVIGAVRVGPRRTESTPLIKLFASVLKHADVDVNAQLTQPVSIGEGVMAAAGSSCLHIAVLGASKCTGGAGGFGFGHPGLVQLLLRAHVNRTLQDSNGQLAVELLSEQDREEFPALLASLVGSYGKKELQVAEKLTTLVLKSNEEGGAHGGGTSSKGEAQHKLLSFFARVKV